MPVNLKEEISMNDYQKMQSRREELIQKIQKIRIKLMNLPQGKLHLQRDGGYIKWYLHQKSKEGIRQRTYLSKTNQQEAEMYALSTLYQAKLEDAQEELSAVEKYLKIREKNREPSSTFVSREERILKDPEYVRLLSRFRTQKQRQIENWKNTNYPDNSSFHPEQLNVQVEGDFFVRSKSERLIAKQLMNENLAFHYEERLGEGKGSIICDFTIMHPGNLKLYYWEHFGLFDQPGYLKEACSKIENYASRGICLGDQLIVTTETSTHPLTKDEVIRTIQQKFFDQPDAQL